ncbi:outer membrane lipoprotein carrier protein LolA [bacterium]|nr:outer membrane lipoprotein carrier protein LolA [bacterium]
MKKYIYLLSLLFTSFQSSAKIEGESSLVLKSVISRYERLGNWKAKFTQHIHSVGLNSGNFSQGIFYFVEPGNFLYSLKGPEYSDFVSNGKKAWHIKYPGGPKGTPEAKIFSDVRKLDLNRYLLFLRGFKGASANDLSSIDKDFKVEGKKQGETLILTLEPKGESDISQIRLVFLNSVEAPSEVNITDLLGTTTKIKITSFEKIKKPDMKLFQPDLPKNAKIQHL